jgi:large-conductance mechanosensitive channel
VTCDSSVVFSGTAGVRIKSPSNTIINKLLYLLFVESKYHKCFSGIWISQSLVLCVAFYGSLSSLFFFFVVLYFFLFVLFVCLLNTITKKGALDSQPEVIKFTSYLPIGRWFSPNTPASSITKTGRHDIVEILLKVASNTNNPIK